MDNKNNANNINNMNDILKIKVKKTSKNDIFQRKAMQENLIPKCPSITALIGQIGSGKSNVLVNLLEESYMYGISNENYDKQRHKYYSKVWLLSNSHDDLFDPLIKNKLIDHVKYDPTVKDVQHIIDLQTTEVKNKGHAKANTCLVIFDDVVNNKKLLATSAVLSLFIRPRQMNISVIITSQYFKLIPPALRANFTDIITFEGNDQEVELICEAYCPPGITRKEFKILVSQATEARPDDLKPFLYINRRSDKDKRFRRNFTTYLQPQL